jgi:purine-binding chemotaxis protein CheW
LEHDSIAPVDEPVAYGLHDILRARARALAVPPVDHTVAHFAELVVFRIGGERYAIDAVELRQAIAVSEVTALPGVPAFYRGVISHQGTAYPLVNICALLGRASDNRSLPAEAMLIAFESFKIAICADAVESFERIDAATIADVHATDEGLSAAAIRGVTDEGIVVLDIRTLLADARLVVDDRPSTYDQSLKGTT